MFLCAYLMFISYVFVSVHLNYFLYIIAILQRYFNSAMMPNWKELLPSILRTDVDEDDENEDTNNKEDVDFIEKLRSFKEGFDIYIKEERAKANVSQSMSLERAKSGGRGIDFAVKVLREIEEGDELCKFRRGVGLL